MQRAALDAWHCWASATLAQSKETFKSQWFSTYQEAPVWRFTLPGGMCGPSPLLGLWLPSVDKVGRYFPLIIAATGDGSTPEQMARRATAWLDAAEDAGRAAIADDLSPEQLKARIPPPPDFAATPDTGLPYNLQPRPGAGLWWTEGSPRVPAQGLVLDTLPDAATFVAMLDAEVPGPGDAR